MRKIKIIGISLIILVSIFIFEQDIFTRNYSSMEKAIVKIIITNSNYRTIKGVGSGFIITSNGYVMTNHHVIKNYANDKSGHKILVQVFDNDTKYTIYDAGLVSKDSYVDVALLKLNWVYRDSNGQIYDSNIKKAGKNFSYLKLGNSDNLSPGTEISVAGFPWRPGTSDPLNSLSLRMTFGRIESFIDNGEYFESSARIEHGNSGGPAIIKNSYGNYEVVGISVQGRPNTIGSYTYVYIPINYSFVIFNDRSYNAVKNRFSPNMGKKKLIPRRRCNLYAIVKNSIARDLNSIVIMNQVQLQRLLKGQNADYESVSNKAAKLRDGHLLFKLTNIPVKRNKKSLYVAAAFYTNSQGVYAVRFFVINLPDERIHYVGFTEKTGKLVNLKKTVTPPPSSTSTSKAKKWVHTSGNLPYLSDKEIQVNGVYLKDCYMVVEVYTSVDIFKNESETSRILNMIIVLAMPAMVVCKKNRHNAEHNTKYFLLHLKGNIKKEVYLSYPIHRAYDIADVIIDNNGDFDKIGKTKLRSMRNDIVNHAVLEVGQYPDCKINKEDKDDKDDKNIKRDDWYFGFGINTMFIIIADLYKANHSSSGYVEAAHEFYFEYGWRMDRNIIHGLHASLITDSDILSIYSLQYMLSYYPFEKYMFLDLKMGIDIVSHDIGSSSNFVSFGANTLFGIGFVIDIGNNFNLGISTGLNILCTKMKIQEDYYNAEVTDSLVFPAILYAGVTLRWL